MGAEVTFSMFASERERELQRTLSLADPGKPAQPLTEKYRPQCFAHVLGQTAAVARLTAYVKAPYSTAFLFSGETGTGKTSTALALANELSADPFWSVHRISAGEMDAEAVATALKSLRFSAPGSGWKVVICDEADSMSAKAKQLWLSALEDLPAKSVIVFTTNRLAKFERRFIDRCESIEFTSSADELLDDAQRLMNALWQAEGIEGEPVDVREFPGIIEKGAISFRRIVRAFEAARHSPPQPRQATVSEPSTVSLDLAARRRLAALKAVATRRARLAQKEA